MGPIELDAAIDCVLLIPEQATLYIHVFEAERVFGPDQRRQRTHFYVEIPFDKFDVPLRKRPVNVFDGVCR